MYVFHTPRGFGKTSNLVILSSDLGIPILCPTFNGFNAVKSRAEEMNREIPDPFCLKDLKDGRLKAGTTVFIDDADLLLPMLTKLDVRGITLTGNLPTPWLDPTMY